MIRVFSQYGRAGTTFKLTSSNTATGLSEDVLTAGGRQLCAIMLQAAINDVKIAFGTDPVQGATELGHLVKAGQPHIYLVGETLLRNMKYISAESGQHGVLVITPFYRG